MNYKAYKQEPHVALQEIKNAFEDEKPYKAQSICLTYFTYIENQCHIEKAIDYSSKDDVYKYIQKHMNKENIPTNESNSLNDFKWHIEDIDKKRKELATIMKAVECFCKENNIEMGGLLTKYLPKQVKDMSEKEFIELAKASIERQNGKIVYSKDIIPMPTPDEMEKLAKEAVEFNMSGKDGLVKAIGINLDK